MASKLPRFRITYYDDGRAPDVVVVGHWEMVLAERKFGVGCAQAGNLDSIMYSAFLGAKRAKVVPDGVDYDAWASTVAVVDEAGEVGESPAPPAT